MVIPFSDLVVMGCALVIGGQVGTKSSIAMACEIGIWFVGMVCDKVEDGG